jgi:hypothetical protein
MQRGAHPLGTPALAPCPPPRLLRRPLPSLRRPLRSCGGPASPWRPRLRRRSSTSTSAWTPPSHRDISSSNIFVEADMRARLGDSLAGSWCRRTRAPRGPPASSCAARRHRGRWSTSSDRPPHLLQPPR